MPSINISATDYADIATDAGPGTLNVQGGSTLVGSNANWYTGWRFQGVAIPQGAIIVSASLTAPTASPAAGVFGYMSGVAADNWPVWEASAGRPSQAPRTGYKEIPVSSGTTVVDVAALVQLIVNRSGWASGNSMSFVGAPIGNGNYAIFNRDTANTLLSVTYAVPIKMTAATGTFTISGKPASLLRGRKLSAAPGAFTVGGQAAALRRGYALRAAAASFSIAGKAAALIRSRRMPASTGSFAITGNAADLRVSKLVAETGTFAISGQAVSFQRAYVCKAEPATFALTFWDAELVKQRAPGWQPLPPAQSGWQAAGPAQGVWTALTSPPGAWTSI